MTGSLGFHAGLAAEDIVAHDYQRRGYPILERRWRGPGGEIDLIAGSDDAVIFIEVKKSRSFANAAQRLNARQIARIHASAAAYLDLLPKGNLTDARFDVALVDGLGAIQIIENAGQF